MLVACLMVLNLFLVHVAVGFGEDGVDVVDGCAGEGVAESDADACGAEAVVELGADGTGLRTVLDFFYHEEFVASHAEDGVCGAGGFQEAGSGLDERVTGFVPKAVIRLLEAVEISEEEGILAVVGQILKIVEQAAAVHDGCQRVNLAQVVDVPDQVAVAQQDGEEARECLQERERFFHLFGRGIDDLEVAVGTVVEAQAHEDQALEVRQARRVAVVAAEGFDVVDGEDGLFKEVLVERMNLLAREGLDLAREWQGILCILEVGAAQHRRRFFGDEEMIG